MINNEYGPGKPSLIVYAIPSVVLFLILFYVRGIQFEDDAFILYRYAVNWANGHGLVFNIGERVEGVSTFLWSAILAVLAFFSADLPKLGPLVNLAVGIACLFLISRLVSFMRFSMPRLMALLLPVFCAVSYGFYYYVASGMDAIIFGLVILIAVISLQKSIYSGKYLFPLLPLILLDLVRAEGFLYSITLIMVLTFFVRIKTKKIPGQLVACIIFFGISTLLMFIIRYYYYGEWMPATVMAKGYGTYLIKESILKGDIYSFISFLKVIKSGIRYELFLIVIGAWIPFILLLKKPNREDMFLWLIATAILTNVSVSVLAGGDYFPFKRHFIAVLPLLIVFVAWAFDSLYRQYWKSAVIGKMMLITGTLFVLVAWTYTFITPDMPDKKYFMGSRHTKYLREIGVTLRNIPAQTVMLSQMIGAISYYAGPKVYVRDILGLTDIHNAKFGQEWGFHYDGRGPCGRTDFQYSFYTPFDIFFYNSTNMHNRFVAFCRQSPGTCKNYRYFKSSQWPSSYFYVVVNKEHPVAAVLREKFDAVAVPIDTGNFADGRGISVAAVQKEPACEPNDVLSR
jgi:hypothetical protein